MKGRCEGCTKVRKLGTDRLCRECSAAEDALADLDSRMAGEQKGPERIWAYGFLQPRRGMRTVGWWEPTAQPDSVEYVRADLAGLSSETRKWVQAFVSGEPHFGAAETAGLLRDVARELGIDAPADTQRGE